jgi:Lon-like protease
MRKLLFVLSIGLIVTALVVVPLPVVVAIMPGPTISAPEGITLVDAPIEVTGDVKITTVAIGRTSTVGALLALFDDDRDLMLRQTIVPEGVDEDEFNEVQRRLFEESVRVAVAVGVEAAGHDVEVTGDGAQVGGVLEGGPADGVLREGDVIVEIDGRPVSVAADLVAVTSQRAAGDTVSITFRRGDDERRREIELAEVAESERPAIGVVIRTVGLRTELPFDVEVDVGEVGGPSGGLMVAIAAYDQASDEDLTRGRIVAGTGTIDLAGNVGSVGGIPQKVSAATDAGATVFLVSTGDADAAREAAGDDLEVIVVATLDEALAELRR